MKQILFNIIFCVVAGVLVAVAPPYYSYNFCLAILILYIVQNIIFWQTKINKSLVCFEFFFLIAFGITNFIYPIVYYPSNSTFAIFGMPFNELIISKSTAIAYFAYSCYLLGISQMKKNELTDPDRKPFVFDGGEIKVLFYITLLCFFLFVLSGGLSHLQNVYSGDGDIREVGLFSYVNNIFIVFCYLMLMFNFRQRNKRNMIVYMLFVMIFVVLLLMTGSRTQALAFGLISIASFDLNIRKFKSIEVLALIVVGVVIMAYIAIVRVNSVLDGDWVAEAEGKSDFTSSFDLFSDLVVNNRNLYVLVDYADNVDYTYFRGIISDITSPFPGLFSLILKHSNMPIELMSGGALPTYIELGEDSLWGLGTNMVGEAYVAFGLPGVVFFFFSLGWIIRKSRQEMNYNIYAYVIYFLFISHAIFYPRAPILYNPRNVAWSLLVIFAFMAFRKIKQGEKTTEIIKNDLLSDKCQR